MPSDLVYIRSALRVGEIAVIPLLALDSFCRTERVDANDVVAALARGMVETTEADGHRRDATYDGYSDEFDLAPLRLMIINKQGGVASYARSGMSRLLINLGAETSYISETFDTKWRASHPTALFNLCLARTCLAYIPPSSSAIMVSHRLPSSLIAKLITNKPAVSSRLPHALLQGNRKLTPHTPTLLWHGLPIRVLRSVAEINKAKLKAIVEQACMRTLGGDLDTG